MRHGENYIKDSTMASSNTECVVLLGMTGAGKSTLMTVAENDPNQSINLNWDVGVIIEGNGRLSKQNFKSHTIFPDLVDIAYRGGN